MKETTIYSLKVTSVKILLLFLFIFLINVFNAGAQQKKVTGKVVDALNQPISNASVTIKGQEGKGTITDDKGYFAITASPNDTLLFSSVGYGSLEKKLGTENTITIGLTNASTSMNDVVVIGYGTMARKNLTTAVSKIDPKTVPQAANNSVAQLIFGRAAGVQAIQQSAEPGGAINVAIRGRGNH